MVGAERYRPARRGQRASNSSVFRSGLPPSNFVRASANSGSGDTAPNDVIGEQNLRSSDYRGFPW
jgi:hypothetical protein